MRRGPSGRRIEGAGVVPDVPVTPTREQLLSGKDPVVEAALAWIASARVADARKRHGLDAP
mgnify:CR=1 FL=1